MPRTYNKHELEGPRRITKKAWHDAKDIRETASSPMELLEYIELKMKEVEEKNHGK